MKQQEHMTRQEHRSLDHKQLDHNQQEHRRLVHKLTNSSCDVRTDPSGNYHHKGCHMVSCSSWKLEHS
jgi:hypothetical protein